MELHQLRYFCAVANTSNFTRAAEFEHVAQPSLSQQILKLEDELGVKLFDRLGRKARLTPFGETFLRRFLGDPKRTGAVAPSGPFLAREMARAVDPAAPGLIVELGPGTGPVTKALLARGVCRALDQFGLHSEATKRWDGKLEHSPGRPSVEQQPTSLATEGNR